MTPFAQGDRCPGFIAEAGRCWAMVYDHNCQATHCNQQPNYTGRWFSPKKDGTWSRVWSCQHHLDGLRTLRQFDTRLGDG